MATIGSITIAFGADLKGLSDGIEESLDLFDDLKEGIEELSENLSGLSEKEVTVKASVNTAAVKKARSEVDALADAAENSSPAVKVSADKTAVDELKTAVEETPKEVTLKSSAKEVVKAAAEAAKEVKPLKGGFYIPIKVAYGSLVEARKAVAGLDVAARVAMKSLLGFNGSASSSVITAANITRAWSSAASAYEASTGAAVNLDRSLRTIAKSGADQKQLSAAAVEGGSAFVGAAAGASLHAAATQAVAAATKDFNEPLRESTRFLAEIGIGYAQAAVSAKVAESSAKLLKTAIESEVNPLAAVAAFSRSYAEGLEELSVSATAAIDRQEAFARASALVSEVAKTLRDFGSTVLDTLIVGYNRARVAGEMYFKAASRGLSAVSRSVDGQLRSLGVYSALSKAAQTLGDSIVRLGGYFVGVNASTRLGRIAFDLFRASAIAMQSTIAEVAGYFGVLRSAASAAISALPGGTAIVKAFADGWKELSGTALKVSTNTSYLTGAVKLAATAFAVASVAGGKFADELAHMGQEAQSTRNLADRFGASTQEIEKLKFAADSAGVGISQLAKGQQTLFTSLSKIRVGQINTDNVREAKLAFDKLGIGMEELKEKSPQEVFEDIAKKLTAIKDPADRTAIAFDLFGKQGAAILPALKSLGQIEKDVERLDVTTSTLDFTRIEEMGKSFSRLRRATASYGEASLASYTELQAGFNNFKADVIGGLASLVQNSGSLYADFTKPIAVVLEVFGRIINVILRAAAVVVKLASAFSPFPTIARFAQALGEQLKELVEPLEEAVSAADAFAQSMYAAMTPDYWTGATEGGKTLTQQLIDTTKALGIMIVSAGVAQAAMTGLGIQPGAAFAKLLGSITITKAGLLSFAKSAVATALSSLKLLVVGLYQTSVNFVAAGTKMIATSVAIGVQTVVAWVAPSLAAMASYVTGINATAIAARIASIGMAASWVIATAGIALIPIAIAAVYQNFDQLVSFFSDFTGNVAKLFTFAGAADAAKAVAGAIWNAFKSVLSGIGGFVGSIIQKIMGAFAGIKPPEAIKAAKASAEDIVKQRERVAQSKFEAQKTVQVNFGIVKGEEPVMPAVDDQKALIKSINESRKEMDALIIESAKFGEAGGKAADSAAADFDKLQQQLSDGVIDPQTFEEKSAEIAKTLKENLKFFSEDNAAVALQKNRDFFKSLNDLVKQSAKEIRDLQSGTVVDGKLFPTSDAIKAESNRVQAEYEDELKSIQQKRQRGEFGSGEAGEQNAAVAVEEAQRKQKRALDNIGRDTSFADDIRKSLEDAFLTPVGAFEKRMKKIADNKSLSAIEKGQAFTAERKQFVEQNFGKTQAETFAERRQAIDKASTPDQTGFRAISKSREEVERRKLDADRRSSAGVENSPGQQLQLGVDKINDAFGVAGKTIEEIQASLSPEDFRDYQEALKKNSDAVKANLGVEKAGADKLSESLRRLVQAVKDGVITEQEKNKALKRQRDELLSSLGIQKTPAQDFEDAVAKIKENASALNPEEIALGLKEAKDKLLSSLGVEKGPAQQNAEAMKKITEAFKAGQLSLEEFRKAVKKAGEELDAKLGVSKSPMKEFRDRMKEIDDAFKVDQKNMPLADAEAKKKKREEAARANLASGLGIDVPAVFGAKFGEQMENLTEAFGFQGRFNSPRDQMRDLENDRKNRVGDFRQRQGESGDDYRERTRKLYLERKGEISDRAQGFGEGRRQLLQSLPGSSPESPVQQFQRDLQKLEAIRGQLTNQEFSERKLNLQAQLQEDLKPSLDATKADRRGIEGSDARSKGGVDTFFRILRGNDNPSLKAQLAIQRNTQILAEAARNKDAAPVIAQLGAR